MTSAVGEEHMAATSLKRVALAQQATKGKQIQVEGRQHSTNSWESFYQDTSVASPPRIDVAQEISQEAVSTMAIPVIPLPAGGNYYRT